MATIIAEPGAVESDIVLEALLDGLPDDYYVLPYPAVYGHELEWLVVAPSGIYHLDVRDWQGSVWANDEDAWLVEAERGSREPHPSPVRVAREARRAVSSFLADEAPRLAPPFRALLVFSGELPVVFGSERSLPMVLLDEAVERVREAPAALGSGLEEPEARAALAEAFDRRRLALRQRAARPFVLATSGWIKTNLEAWTLEDLIRLFDRHSGAAVKHMLDGSLEEWLDAEGAYELADLVREALQAHPSDGRAALESFMLSSGYVQPPELRLQPRRLVMGYVLTDEVVRHELVIGRRGKRGHLFGELAPLDAWVRVEPAQFSGRTKVMVSVDTTSLPVSAESQSSVAINAGAGHHLKTVPVTVRVRPRPSEFTVRVARPLLGLLAGLVAGVVFNWAVYDFVAAGTLASRMNAGVVALWGLAGLIRGFAQPPAWPNVYAIERWLIRVLAWGLGLAAVLMGLLWLVHTWYPEVCCVATAFGARRLFVSIILALSVVPGTIAEHRRAKALRYEPLSAGYGRILRNAWRVVAVLALLVVGLFEYRLLQPRIQQMMASPQAVETTETTKGVLQRVEERLNGWVDGLYVRYLEEQQPGKATGLDAIKEWFSGGR
jgi:hypothetical protein